MNSYKLMYLRMIRASFDVMDLMESEDMKKYLSEDAPQRIAAAKAVDIIKQSHIDCEKIYMEYGDEEDERGERERNIIPG